MVYYIESTQVCMDETDYAKWCICEIAFKVFAGSLTIVLFPCAQSSTYSSQCFGLCCTSPPWPWLLHGRSVHPSTRRWAHLWWSYVRRRPLSPFPLPRRPSNHFHLCWEAFQQLLQIFQTKKVKIHYYYYHSWLASFPSPIPRSGRQQFQIEVMLTIKCVFFSNFTSKMVFVFLVLLRTGKWSLMLCCTSFLLCLQFSQQYKF